ncbi:hypothetical protein [Altibacter sp. HG106]|uniref:hypothetical protein n=1 Tax=Altibacter sp. HG106 TaxID=3023937 RepID=UPI0023506C8C|nr:hypothetical protein [Altibacter sp. HG106]MDC7995175.1 hypothetical protein [Altibacter sp. HG106]
MTTMLKTTCVLVSVFFLAQCDATKNTSEAPKSNDAMTENATAKKMMEEGFKAGTIVYSQAEEDCPYTIQIENDEPSYFLDPVNLEESYKKDGMKVWVQYAGMRMMNRCEKANPVNVVAIQKREE